MKTINKIEYGVTKVIAHIFGWIAGITGIIGLFGLFWLWILTAICWAAAYGLSEEADENKQKNTEIERIKKVFPNINQLGINKIRVMADLLYTNDNIGFVPNRYSDFLHRYTPHKLTSKERELLNIVKDSSLTQVEKLLFEAKQTRICLEKLEKERTEMSINDIKKDNIFLKELLERKNNK